MFKPAIKNNRTLQSPQVLNALIAVVRPYLPLDLQNTRITAEDLIVVLDYASSNRISIDPRGPNLISVCQPQNSLHAQQPNPRVLTVDAVVVKKYSKGRYKRKGARWFDYAVGRLPKSIEAHQVFEMYRQHFGIEASYRQMNQVRARTTSRNPVLRLLLVGLAFIIFNLYIALRQHIAICLKNPVAAVSNHWLTLRRLARMIAHPVETLFDLSAVVFRHTRFALS